MIDTVFFDLDGTLLPMDQEKFVECYLGLLARDMAPHGYEPRQLVKTIWAGTGAMVKNDGSRVNEEVFWETFRQVYGQEAMKDMPLFEEFYEKRFRNVQPSCGYDPDAARLVEALKARGYRLVLATNPIFPATATHQRMQWAGLKREDFELVTTYENSRFCKPNPEYYRQILGQLGLEPERCMMVGNDVTEDMAAAQAGMATFLLTDCLINKHNQDIGVYRHGTLHQLLELVEAGKL